MVPQRMHGLMMLPWVSLPMANATRPAAVAEAGPALEPEEPSCGSHGFIHRGSGNRFRFGNCAMFNLGLNSFFGHAFLLLCALLPGLHHILQCGDVEVLVEVLDGFADQLA